MAKTARLREESNHARHGRLGQVMIKTSLAFNWIGLIGVLVRSLRPQWIRGKSLRFRVLLFSLDRSIIRPSQTLAPPGLNADWAHAARFPGLCWAKAAAGGGRRRDALETTCSRER